MANSKFKFILLLLIFLLVIFLSLFFIYQNLFGAPNGNAIGERFVVSLNSNDSDITNNLEKNGFIKSPWAFNFVLNWKKLQNKIAPGGYKISKAMNAWEIARVLSGQSYMKWITIPEGLRKEEIANLLAKNLAWTEEEKQKWISTDTALKPDYFEGVYFPDTYLIPIDEKPADVASRFQTHFEEKFAPYAKEAVKQNIKWTTLLTLASIIQREAASKNDMNLIAGVLWNRLSVGMPLGVDATIQYARGDTGAGFWAPIQLSDKKIDSPYNTFTHKGLPPHPISNPGVEAISSALNPEKTECLYYLHDKSKIIHCAVTFEEHKQNIAKYLQ
ncbi:MAG: endolytic transglycosylase MltG [Candidatus Paceibacterota bacterium]